MTQSRTSRSAPQGVVAVIERDGRWLVIRRADGIRAAGWWCFPGGGIEPGESAPEALVREIREEVGLDVEATEELWQWRRPEDRLRLFWWRAELTDPDQPVICDPAEVAEARWLVPEQIYDLDPILPGNLAFLDHHLTGD